MVREWAIILAGGRSARLGGTPKATLTRDGQTLLTRAVAACPQAERIAVVGPTELVQAALGEPTTDLVQAALGEPTGDRIVATCESPPHGGPAQGIAAGVAALSHGQPAPGPDDPIAVIACDLPGVGVGLATLGAALAAAPSTIDGVIGCDLSGRRQWLLGVHRWASLAAACETLAARPDGGRGAAVRELFAACRLNFVPLADAATADVDTWEAARNWGLTSHDPSAPRRDPTERTTMTEYDPLTTWADQAAAALGLPDASALDLPALLDMTRIVAHQVARPAAPLTAFLAGYAAGLRGGQAADVAAALAAVTQLAEARGEA